MSNIPHDIEAEEVVIGSTMVRPDLVIDVANDLDAEDFYAPKHQAVWSAFRQMWERDGVKPDPVSLAHEASNRGANVLPDDLFGLMTNSLPPNRRHVDIIKSTKAARDIMAFCQETLASVTSGGDPYELGEEMDHFASSIGATSNDPEALTFWELSESAEAMAPDVIPGLMKLDWRCMVIGGEGVGKAVLMRSMAMTAAQGIHVFTHKPIEPQRTLYIDLENPAEAILETGTILETTLMNTLPDYDEDRFRIWRRPGGMDIRRRQDRADLLREIAYQKPTLVCIGPLYKMYRKQTRENYEDAADDVCAILDDMRTKFGFALVIEHHAPKGSGGHTRELVPMGSQRWMGWPELGIGLRENENVPTILDVEMFRKPRLHTDWPQRINRDRRYLVQGVWDDGRQ